MPDNNINPMVDFCTPDKERSEEHTSELQSRI